MTENIFEILLLIQMVKLNRDKGGLSTSPFENLRLSTKNQIVKSPFEKDYT